MPRKDCLETARAVGHAPTTNSARGPILFFALYMASSFLHPCRCICRSNPSRTAAPFWGQTAQRLSSLSPKRDCGSKTGFKVNPSSRHCFFFVLFVGIVRVRAREQYFMIRKLGAAASLPRAHSIVSARLRS